VSTGVFSLPQGTELGGAVRAVFFDAGNTLTYLDVAWIAERLCQDGWQIDQDAVTYGQNIAAYEASRLALLKRYPTDADRLTPYFSRVLELAGIPLDFARDYAGLLIEEHRTAFLWRWVPEYVLDTLTELQRRGYILGVISNSDGRLRQVLDRASLTRYFTCVIDSGVVGFEKPDPRIFHLAVEAAEAEPARCAYVGDIYAVDIEGARRAGLTGILLDPMHLHEEFACARIARLPDLLAMFPPLGDSNGNPK